MMNIYNNIKLNRKQRCPTQHAQIPSFFFFNRVDIFGKARWQLFIYLYLLIGSYNELVYILFYFDY
jgi:hypothetical protein